MNRLGIKCFILGTFVLVFFAADRGEMGRNFEGRENSEDDGLSDYLNEVDSCLNELCGFFSE